MRALKFLQLEAQRASNSGETQACAQNDHVYSKKNTQTVKTCSSKRIQKNAVFAGFETFAPVSAIEMLMNNALHRYYSSDDDPISAAVKLFTDVIKIHPFEERKW